MIIVDTNVWADHLRGENATLADLLEREEVLAHPFVVGEIALGSLRDRARTIRRLLQISEAPLARHGAVMALIEQNGLYGSGVGYIDAHLLASARLFPDARVWTRDRRLREAADRLLIAAPFH